MPWGWLCNCDVFDVAYYTCLSMYGHLVPTKSTVCRFSTPLGNVKHTMK